MSAVPAASYTNARAGPLATNICQVLAALPGYMLQVEMESQAKVLVSHLVGTLFLLLYEPCIDIQAAHFAQDGRRARYH